jgi:hypothetical protein
MTQPIARNRIAPVASKASKGRPAPKPQIDEKRRRYVVAGIGLLLLVVLIAYWWSRPSAALAHVRELQHDLFSKSRDKMPADERKEKFDALRAEREKLSEDERNALRKEVSKDFQKKRSAEAIAYLKMSHAERMKVIDDKIAREQKNAATGNNGGNRPAPAPAATRTPAAAAAAVPSGDSGKPPPKMMSAEDRDNRRREMLIRVSPDARAGMDQMRLDMATRRAQKGLSPQTGRQR